MEIMEQIEVEPDYPFMSDDSYTSSDSELQQDMGSDLACDSTNSNNSILDIDRIKTEKGDAENSGTLGPLKWKRNVNKLKRMIGEPYMGYSKRGSKVIQDTPRKGRALGKPCTSPACIRFSNRRCSEISEEQRTDLFTTFWKAMSWQQRKIYVTENIEPSVPHRRYHNSEKSRRSLTLRYNLTFSGEKYPVCKLMFLSTLALGDSAVHNWVKDLSVPDPDPGLLRKKKDRKNVSFKSTKKAVSEFFESLQILPSRDTSRKLMFEANIRSMSVLYELYRGKIRSENKVNEVSRKTFNDIFTMRNYTLYNTEANECEKCAKHETGEITDTEWNKHVSKENRAWQEKVLDKKEADRRRRIVLQIDLQPTKLLPCLQSSAEYYFKKKLCCHNFTVLNLQSKRCVCYWFSDIDSELSPSTFATLIIDYLKENCDGEKDIVIYSDGCTSISRNFILSNALLDYAIASKATVTQKFLERVHTEMECTNVHSAIDQKLKNQEIHMSSDYVQATIDARKKPHPYHAKWVNYEMFLNYADENFHRIKNITPSDANESDLKALQYLPSGKIMYKLDYDGKWLKFPEPIKNISGEISWQKLYKSPIPISLKNYQDLQELKIMLPSSCHEFYDGLPHLIS